MGYYVKVDSDMKIYVQDVNSEGNKTILFIHGWPANHKLFEYQFNELPKNGYRCIGVDLRGFGSSDKPWNGYSYNQMADDISAVVKALKLKDFVLAGHSVGGAIAIRYMARHNGEGVSKLILISAAAPSFVKTKEFPYGLNKEDVDKLINQTYSDRPKMLEGFGEMFFFKHVTRPFSDWFFQLGLQAAGYSTIALATSLRDENLFKDITQITVPTLIIHGIHDKVCPIELGEAQEKAIKGSKLIPFSESGHGPFWEERDKFNKEVMGFIEDKISLGYSKV